MLNWLFGRYIPGEGAPARTGIPQQNTGTHPKLSPWRYGSGAQRKPLQLPPISRTPSSVPTGSNEISHWPNSNATRPLSKNEH